MAEGVILQAWVSHFVIAPPLIVTKEELDHGIDTLDRHLAIADALVDTTGTPHLNLPTDTTVTSDS